jgi:hypothetical protein
MTMKDQCLANHLKRIFSNLYSGGGWFEFQSGPRLLLTHDFRDFPRSFPINAVIYLKVWRYHFVPIFFQLIIIYHLIIRGHTIRNTETDVTETTGLKRNCWWLREGAEGDPNGWSRKSTHEKIKSKDGKIVPVHYRTHVVLVELKLPVCLTSKLVWVKWSASQPCRFTPGKNSPVTDEERQRPPPPQMLWIRQRSPSPQEIETWHRDYPAWKMRISNFAKFSL